MAGYKIQLKDKNGNRQYPVSTTDVVVDADGVSVADLLDRKQPMLVSGVNIKTINGKTLLGEGDLVIEGGTADLSGYATEEYVDAKVGESYPIYYSYDGTPLTEEQKAANKMAVDKYVADESIVLYPHMGSVRHPFDVMLTLSEGAWKTAELTNYLFAYFNDDGTTMHYVKVTVEQDGDAQVEFSAESPLVLASKAYVDSKVGGSSEDGGLKYFVERYVYEGKTEEERTYNLESLAMLDEGADILWAGMGGLQPNHEYGSMWGYMTTLNNYYGIFAKADIDSETGALVIQTVEFIRDFYFAQGSEMKVLAANFFKIEGWAWEPAFYMARPILYWHDGETNTMVNAYFLLDGLKTAYVSINIETGEVGSPVPVQSN